MYDPKILRPKEKRKFRKRTFPMLCPHGYETILEKKGPNIFSLKKIPLCMGLKQLMELAPIRV